MQLLGFQGNQTKNFIEKIEINMMKLSKMGFNF